jgi:quercetin dioxygenase-like cupin family protein
MRLKILFLIVSVFCIAATPLRAADDYARVVNLFDGSKNIVGETLVYPETGPAKVTSLIVTMKPGETTGPHRHGVPTYGYILEGQVTVDYGTDGKRTYRKGEAFMEAETVAHDGTNDGDVPVRILVVFMGAEGSENVIREK